jgi:hypothetical protein
MSVAKFATQVDGREDVNGRVLLAWRDSQVHFKLHTIPQFPTDCHTSYCLPELSGVFRKLLKCMDRRRQTANVSGCADCLRTGFLKFENKNYIRSNGSSLLSGVARREPAAPSLDDPAPAAESGAVTSPAAVSVAAVMLASLPAVAGPGGGPPLPLEREREASERSSKAKPSEPDREAEPCSEPPVAPAAAGALITEGAASVRDSESESMPTPRAERDSEPAEPAAVVAATAAGEAPAPAIKSCTAAAGAEKPLCSSAVTGS